MNRGLKYLGANGGMAYVPRRRSAAASRAKRQLAKLNIYRVSSEAERQLLLAHYKMVMLNYGIQNIPEMEKVYGGRAAEYEAMELLLAQLIQGIGLPVLKIKPEDEDILEWPDEYADCLDAWSDWVEGESMGPVNDWSY